MLERVTHLLHAGGAKFSSDNKLFNPFLHLLFSLHSPNQIGCLWLLSNRKRDVKMEKRRLKSLKSSKLLASTASHVEDQSSVFGEKVTKQRRSSVMSPGNDCLSILVMLEHKELVSNSINSWNFFGGSTLQVIEMFFESLQKIMNKVSFQLLVKLLKCTKNRVQF